MYSREGPVTFARDNLKAHGITYVNEIIPYVHYSWVVHIYMLFILWFNVQRLQHLLT